jgi:hypothetical protein
MPSLVPEAPDIQPTPAPLSPSWPLPSALRTALGQAETPGAVFRGQALAPVGSITEIGGPLGTVVVEVVWAVLKISVQRLSLSAPTTNPRIIVGGPRRRSVTR